ncbi:hypothetical protein HT031_005838 [Scenedesmus sp. PABB004]|nr:hypothetical protein HT031_005838 [Scenedesmus sp. PABB004]
MAGSTGARFALGALLACAAGQAVLAVAPSPTAVSREWGIYNVQRQGVRVGGLVQGDALRGVLDWPFTTPLAQVQASNVYSAGNARMRRVVDQLTRGEAVKVVAIGGVATNGSDASQPGSDDYFALYVKYLKRAFPSARVDAVRASAGIAPSAVVARCLASFLPADADLVLLEMTPNDFPGMDSSIVDGHNAKAYELLMRRTLTADKQPALILTQTMVAGMGNGQDPFYLTPEAPQYAALASYYGTPVVSMRNALWPSGAPTANGLISTPLVAPADGSTPLSAAHKSIADMLVFNTQRTAEDLLVLPFGDWDRESIASDVPDTPAYADVSSEPDTVLSNSTCLWVRNMSAPATRDCPVNLGQMCGLDFSSAPAMLQGYDARVDTKAPRPSGALIGGIVGGVVGGLLLVGGLLAYCIVSKRRHAAKIAAAAEAKAAARRKEGFGSGGVPITASAARAPEGATYGAVA